MGGRGTFASGNSVAYTYKIVGKINGVKILEGLAGKHSLPEEAHSSNAYIKLRPDGTFHEMRIYGNDHYLKYEIAYHPEQSITGNRYEKVLHIHEYDRSFGRTRARTLTDEEYKKYKKFFKGVPKK
ncbi:MAG: hypothetical protein IJ735_05770 [Clostridia bacterium]|nr:hypothetical protein [Clostridia bacterium]